VKKFHLVKAILKNVPQNLSEYKLNLEDFHPLTRETPEETLLITEVFPESDLEEIYERFTPYLEGHEILPFAHTLGDCALCIGFSQENLGAIYYQDLDFGIYKISDSMVHFLAMLRKKEYPENLY